MSAALNFCAADTNSLDFDYKLNYNHLRYADMAELADAQVSGSCGRPCRFNSCYPHQIK